MRDGQLMSMETNLIVQNKKISIHCILWAKM
jgi:hypothetical protein